MSLAAFPPEIWLEVMSHLDSRFFAEDINRLIVSRAWYRIAQRILWRDVQLGPKSMRAFITQFSRPRALDCLRPHLRSLVLDFRKASDVLEYITALESLDVKHKWYGQLSVDLLELGRILAQCPALRTYSLRSGDSIEFSFTIPETSRSSNPAVCCKPDGPGSQELVAAATAPAPPVPAPSLNHLTSLRIDAWPANADFDRIHMCPVIEHMLPRLQSLHAHLDGICAHALVPPTVGLDKLQTLDIRFGDVGVGMEMSADGDAGDHAAGAGAGTAASPPVVPARLGVHWRRGHGAACTEFWEFMRTIRTTSRALVAGMRSPPKHVRFTFPAPFEDDDGGTTYMCFDGISKRSTLGRTSDGGVHRPRSDSKRGAPESDGVRSAGGRARARARGRSGGGSGGGTRPRDELFDNLDQDHCSITPAAYVDATHQLTFSSRQVLSGLFSLSTSILLGAVLFGHRALEIALFQKLLLYLFACGLHVVSLAVNGCFAVVQ
ncbi:hypothetical protein KEM52_003122 [Ascosphaera acerosa]|nr:hypothetical protein KEM52_003122 [Ascosphaera acerosa]